MKKIYLILILSSLVLSSCITKKKCNERFPPEVYTIEKTDTIVDIDTTTIIKRDTVIVVEIVKDMNQDSINIFDFMSGDTLSVLSNDGRDEAITFLDGKTIKTILPQRTDSLEIVLEGAIRERDRYKELYVKSLKEKREIEKDWYIPDFFYILWGITTTGAFFIGLKIR